jgi:putative transposase
VFYSTNQKSSVAIAKPIARPDRLLSRDSESFNGKLRDELLNGEVFYSLKEAQIVIEQWRKHYNTVRPHSALNYRPPAPRTFAPLARHLDEIMPMQ